MKVPTPMDPRVNGRAPSLRLTFSVIARDIQAIPCSGLLRAPSGAFVAGGHVPSGEVNSAASSLPRPMLQVPTAMLRHSAPVGAVARYLG